MVAEWLSLPPLYADFGVLSAGSMEGTKHGGAGTGYFPPPTHASHTSGGMSSNPEPAERMMQQQQQISHHQQLRKPINTFTGMR